MGIEGERSSGERHRGGAEAQLAELEKREDELAEQKAALRQKLGKK